MGNMINNMPDDVMNDGLDSEEGERRTLMGKLFTPKWYIGEQEDLETWSTRITAMDMMDMYDDPVSSFYSEGRWPESNLYREQSLAGLKDDFRYQSAQQIRMVFMRSNFFFAPARRDLQRRENTRKSRRPDKDVGYPAQTTIAFVREKTFCLLEEEINREVERRGLDRAQERMEAITAGLLEECVICLADDCLPAEMVACQADHRFCKRCLVNSAERVLATGRGVVRCLGLCDMEVEMDALQKVLEPSLVSSLMVNRQVTELTATELERLVSCPFCPYETIMDNTEDKVVKCLNPVCSRDIPVSCKKDVSRRRVEDQLTMSWVRQCCNCKVDFYRVSGCNIITCPKCGWMTCYTCRKSRGYLSDNRHGACDQTYWTDREQELSKAKKRIKGELKEEEMEAMKDLFMPGPSNH